MATAIYDLYRNGVNEPLAGSIVKKGAHTVKGTQAQHVRGSAITTY